MNGLVYPKDFTETEVRSAIIRNVSNKEKAGWVLRSLGDLSQSLDSLFKSMDNVPDALHSANSAIILQMELIERYHQECQKMIDFLNPIYGEPEANHG